jgi:hypothetical protein
MMGVSVPEHAAGGEQFVHRNPCFSFGRENGKLCGTMSVPNADSRSSCSRASQKRERLDQDVYGIRASEKRGNSGHANMWLTWVLICGMMTAMADGPCYAEAPTPLRDLPAAERDARIASDTKSVHVYRDGLAKVVAYAQSRSDLFPATKIKSKEPRVLRREQKEVVWSTWKSFLDYMVALDAVGQVHRDFFFLEGDAREQSFMVGGAAFLAKYRFALDWITLAENEPLFDTILNEPVPELGLPEGTYRFLKKRYLHVARAGEFGAFEAMWAWFGRGWARDLGDGIEADRNGIWAAGKGKGEVLTVKNAFDIVQQKGLDVCFPIQAGVSEWMGDTKVWRPHKSLVSANQIAAMQPRLEPGDILLERREWYVSNVGLPGYWPHAALYIGTAEERRAYFGDSSLDDQLRQRYPEAYALSVAPQEDKHLPRVLEAISEGVSFTTLEHSAAADAVVVLRPRLPKEEKAEAIRRAFHYAGRPYDFNFDFRTDAALVCTELVYKAYEPSAGKRGLTFPMEEMLGRPVMPANLVARIFDGQYGTDAQQLDFVLFLDGHEGNGTAKESDLAAFRQSWKRPKWHILKTAVPEDKGSNKAAP